MIDHFLHNKTIIMEATYSNCFSRHSAAGTTLGDKLSPADLLLRTYVIMTLGDFILTVNNRVLSAPGNLAQEVDQVLLLLQSNLAIIM